MNFDLFALVLSAAYRRKNRDFSINSQLLMPVVGRPRLYWPCKRSKRGNHVFNEFDICRCGEERPPEKTLRKLLDVLHGQKQYRVLQAVKMLKDELKKTFKKGAEREFISQRRLRSSG